MKGKIKCFGLLSVLVIMLGLSLSVSSDVNALKYEITTIPFGQLIGNYSFYTYGDASNYYDSLSLVIPDNALNSLGNTWQYVPSKTLPYFYNSYKNGGYCLYDNTNSAWNSHSILRSNWSHNLEHTTYYWQFPYYDTNIFDYNFSGYESLTPCNVLGSVPNLASADIPTMSNVGGVNVNLKSFVPYRYNYNGIYAQDLNTQDGLYRQSRFRFEELFGNSNSIIQTDGELPDHFESLTIPFGVFTDKNVSTGTSMEVVGKFSFDSRDPLNQTLDLDQNFEMSVMVRYSTFNADGTPSGSNGNSYICNYNLIDNRSNQDEWPYFLEYSCPFNFAGSFSDDSPEKSRIIGITLLIGGGFEYHGLYHFAMDDVYFVTNGDLTPAGKAFSDYTIDGSSPQDAPGSALDPSMPGSTIDWVESLSNLFSFQLFNPFSGFFLLFTDNSGCVNIPIIAGMLHSESDTYCPWFSADTRNIMTPVIGILATMFVFGFIVRWLKSTNSDFSPESSKGGD